MSLNLLILRWIFSDLEIKFKSLQHILIDSSSPFERISESHHVQQYHSGEGKRNRNGGERSATTVASAWYFNGGSAKWHAVYLVKAWVCLRVCGFKENECRFLVSVKKKVEGLRKEMCAKLEQPCQPLTTRSKQEEPMLAMWQQHETRMRNFISLFLWNSVFYGYCLPLGRVKPLWYWVMATFVTTSVSPPVTTSITTFDVSL